MEVSWEEVEWGHGRWVARSRTGLGLGRREFWDCNRVLARAPVLGVVGMRCVVRGMVIREWKECFELWAEAECLWVVVWERAFWVEIQDAGV